MDKLIMLKGLKAPKEEGSLFLQIISLCVGDTIIFDNDDEAGWKNLRALRKLMPTLKGKRIHRENNGKPRKYPAWLQRNCIYSKEEIDQRFKQFYLNLLTSLE